MHVIRQSPRKRLYDTTTHQFVSSRTVRCLADRGEELHVIDGRTGRDVTGRVLPHLLGEIRRRSARAAFKHLAVVVARGARRFALRTGKAAHRLAHWLADALDELRAAGLRLACALRLARAGEWHELARRVQVLLAHGARH